MKNQETFKPYIPADKVTPELTAASVITGIVLAIVFGAANAYLGLRVGMTVSASIPAAVVSMGVICLILKKDSSRLLDQRENPWRQERFLHFLCYFYGHQKERSRHREFWRLQ